MELTSSNLYLLAWHDVLERQDILLGEIRNLQTNIIYVLRQSILYQPLRYEEKMIWGINYKKETTHSGVETECVRAGGHRRCDIEDQIRLCRSVADDASLARRWVIRFPDPNKVFSESNSKLNEQVLSLRASGSGWPESRMADLIKWKLDSSLKDIWLSSAWGSQQRRYYHQLRGLQVIKAQIVQDRITLCRHAFHAELNGLNKMSSERVSHPLNINKAARFMIIRRAALIRIGDYISRFRNHQQQFGKSFDTSYQDHPRPYVERRRDMGMYMDFLAERTRDMREHLNLLLDSIGCSSRNHKNSHSSLILHGWIHSDQAQFQKLIDNVGEAVFTNKSKP